MKIPFLLYDFSIDANFAMKLVDLGNLYSDVQSLADTVIRFGLLISLVVVVYHVANDAKFGKGRVAVGSWFTALIIWIVLRVLFS